MSELSSDSEPHSTTNLPLDQARLRLWPLPAAIGGLCLLTGILCPWLSFAEQLVAACMPMLEGCTTISRTGRYGTAYYVFKGLMLPVAGLLLVFWPVAGAWLRHTAGVRIGLARWLVGSGLVGALLLMVYASLLGSPEPAFAVYRRIGASTFFAGTFLAQLLFVAALGAGARDANSRILRALVLFQLLIGIGSLPVTGWADPATKDYWENVIEWWFALALVGFFPVCAWRWRAEFLLWPTVARGLQGASGVKKFTKI